MKNIFYAFCVGIVLYVNKAYGSEAGMPQLDPEFWISQIFWLTIIFSSLYLMIWKIFLPKITYSIENRKSRIVNNLDEAQKLKEGAEEKLKKYNEIIEDSQKEAKKIIEESKRKLDIDIENKKKKFNIEIEKEIIAAEKEIKSLRKSSISDINNIAAEISSHAIKELINSDINKSNVSAIVNDITKRKLENNI